MNELTHKTPNTETLFFQVKENADLDSILSFVDTLDRPAVFVPPGLELKHVSSLSHLIEKVKQWGIEKGITGLQGKGTVTGQADKMIEEAEETYAAVFLSDDDDPLRSQTKDGIGDTMVTLILLADMHGWTLEECLQHAYDEIKGRTGRMENGTFVKDK